MFKWLKTIIKKKDVDFFYKKITEKGFSISTDNHMGSIEYIIKKDDLIKSFFTDGGVHGMEKAYNYIKTLKS